MRSHGTHGEAFQSTLPVWGATAYDDRLIDGLGISIHAPRVGSDLQSQGVAVGANGISIHAPRVGSDLPNGERVKRPAPFQSTLPVWGATFTSDTTAPPQRLFQSTLPVWGATSNSAPSCQDVVFQSTLPVWGATTQLLQQTSRFTDFNPRSPCGERRWGELYV